MTSAAAAARRLGPRYRLSRTARRAALVVHIASAGGWLGVDIAMAVVIVAALVTRDLATRTSCLRVLELITMWPLLSCGLVCLLSGLVLGLGSTWGVLRYRWVAVKLVLNLVLTALVVVALRPEVAHQAEAARRAATGEPVGFDLTNLIYPPTVSPTLLLVAMTLSVVKPWGRIRWWRGARGDRSPIDHATRPKAGGPPPSPVVE